VELDRRERLRTALFVLMLAAVPAVYLPACGEETRTTEDVAECDENYSDCVPVADDVDCAGGTGDGPAYVEGPVEVIGDDIYELDANGNDVGCE
jgi:hypothetical protein